MDTAAYLMTQVRAADRDRYLAALYAPAQKRGHLLALYAFNAEIASVRDRVHEPMPGEIRLQWWRDAIAEGSGQSTGNPLADALNRTIEANALPRAAFDRMLEARVFDLYDDPMPDRTSLEAYCGETAAALIQLGGLVLDPAAAARSADAAGHAGCAQAITGLLRLLPIQLRRGQCYVPSDILASAGLTRDEFVEGRNRPAAARAVSAMTALAREHHHAFVGRARDMAPALRPAYLPLATVPAQLDRIDANPQAALDEPVTISGPRTHLAYLRKAMRGW